MDSVPFSNVNSPIESAQDLQDGFDSSINCDVDIDSGLMMNEMKQRDLGM